MTQLRQRVERLENAETTSLHFGASANAISSFPGMVNIVAGSGVSFTPGTGTLTITASGGGGTVTSVGVSGSSGIGVSGSPITGSGTITLSLGAITPTSVSTSNLTVSSTVSVPAQSIALASIPNSAGLSVLGRSAASSGVRSDITSTGARTFLASSSANTAVAFRAMDAADFPTGNWIGANSGTAYATSITNLSADTTWFDTGASVSLVAGTYLVTSFCHGLLVTSAGTGQINSHLYNVTDAADVAASECKVISSNLPGTVEATGTLSMILTVAGTKSIRLEAQRSVGGTYSSVSVRNSTTGRSGITYVRIA